MCGADIDMEYLLVTKTESILSKSRFTKIETAIMNNIVIMNLIMVHCYRL